MDLTDIYGTLHFRTKDYNSFSKAFRTYYKIDCIFADSASLNGYKKIEKTDCILSEHHGYKLDINNNRKGKKYTNSCRLNNSLPNKNCGKTELKKELKTFLELNENKTQHTQIQRTWRRQF